jgi:adenylate cyclase
MPLSPWPDPPRIILWATAIGAAVGAAYSQMHVAQYGHPTFALYGIPRGVLTGAVIGSVLSALESLILSGPIGAPLRRAPFPVHVAIKTLIYLAVILLALELGRHVFPSPGERGIEGGDVLFSLAASFVFVFMLDVNSLLGQNVLLNFIIGRYYSPRLESRVFLFLDMEGSTGLAEHASGRSISTAWSTASSMTSPSRSSPSAARFTPMSATN